ncbi:MAG: PepSY domain-containing protein [Gammaproteobacteria bacterium]
MSVLLLVAGQPPAWAGSHGGPAVSLDEAIALVRDKSGGKVVRAETKGKDHHVVHEIRIVTDDGHVRTYVVDGKTGKVK